MTGLVAIASLEGRLDAAEARALVEKMARVQAHRAPGGWRIVARPEMTYIASPSHASGDSGVDDPSEDPKEPILAYDGHLINRCDLQAEVPKADTDDRGLLLRAWKSEGPSCLRRVWGRFAFVVHDPRERITYLVRDRFGHKPLHYAIRDRTVLFASEAKTLLSVMPERAPDERALIEWSMHGDVLPPRTLFQGISTLPVGHMVAIDDSGRVESSAYYDPTAVVEAGRYAEHSSQTIDEVLSLLDEAIDQAVKSHMRGSSSVGVMLSGGVDSTVIAAIAARHGEIKAYNFAIADVERLDERPMAREVAERLGLPLEIILVDGETYRRGLATATYLYEAPLWHMQGVPLHLLARRARQDEIRLLLSGVSVGPLLGAASDRYRWILPPPILDRLPDSSFRVLRKAVYAGAGLPIGNPEFARRLGVAMQLVAGGARHRIVSRCEEAYGFLDDLNERRIQVMRLSDHHLFLPRFYSQGDRLCMGESIEYCDAAVEDRFVSLALNVPTKLIFHKKKSKWIFKELATRYVPREVAFQKKIPMDVPVGKYFTPAYKQDSFEAGS